MKSSKKQQQQHSPQELKESLQKLAEAFELDIGDAEQNKLQLEAEDYINLLKGKYIDMLEHLKQEENLKKKVEEDNIKLREKLSEEIKKQENTLKEGQMSLEQLNRKNKYLIDKTQNELYSKETIEEEITKSNQIIDKLNKQVRETMQRIIQNKNEIDQQKEQMREQSIQNKQILDELDRIQGNTSTSGSNENDKQLQMYQNNILQVTKAISDGTVELQQIRKKQKQVTQERIKIEEEIRLRITDWQSLDKKHVSQISRLNETEELVNQLKIELQNKQENLHSIRLENQKLEQEVIKLPILESQLNVAKEIKNTLLMENQVLNLQLKNIVVDQYDIQQSSQNNSEFYQENQQNIINNKDQQEQQQNEEDHVVYEDIDNNNDNDLMDYQYEDNKEEIDQLHSNLQNKNQVLKEQMMKIQQLNQTLDQLKGDMGNITTSKSVLQKQYETIEKEIYSLNQKFSSVMSKNINNYTHKNHKNYSTKEDNSLEKYIFGPIDDNNY